MEYKNRPAVESDDVVFTAGGGLPGTDVYWPCRDLDL